MECFVSFCSVLGYSENFLHAYLTFSLHILPLSAQNSKLLLLPFGDGWGRLNNAALKFCE